MKASMAALLVWAALASCALPASAGEGSPIGKVLSMLSDLQAKIIKEGEVVQKEYAKFSEWCEDRSRELTNEITTGKAEVEGLKAAIAEEVASASASESKVEELAAGISTDEADLKAASEIRGKEAADFAAEEKELMETIDLLGRAVAVLERETRKGGAAMLQLNNAGSLVQAVSVMLQASLIGGTDAAKLSAFLQDAQKSGDTDSEDAAGAPAGAVYESHSGDIVETLQGLADKAEAQLDDARKKETAAQHNFELLEQSLKDEIKFASKELDEAKKSIAASGEKKSSSEGDLGAVSKDLAADVESKQSLHHDCMTRAQDFESETKSRGEELKALASAKQLIEEATGGALAQVSFLQVARTQLESRADLANFEAVRLVRDLARKESSTALAQLASRMASALRQSSGSADPFAKVKALISDMIGKLEAEAGADATKKAYCDKELAESRAKKSDKSDEIAGLSTKLEQMNAKSAQLKEEVAELEGELSKLSKSQANMDNMRWEEKESYLANKAELEKGLDGLKAALKVLNEYYAQDGGHEKAAGSAGGIISLLEVCESDFTKSLAEITTEEETAAAEHEQVTKENEIEKTTKDQDVKYKTKASKELDKTAAETTSDRTGVQAELDAVSEYLARIEAECIAKAEPYAERAARREAEIAGLKEALQTLESETALLQRRAAHRLRGATRAPAQAQLAAR